MNYICGREHSSEIVNPKFVIYSFSEYLFNTYCVSRWGVEDTAKQVDTFPILMKFIASHSKQTSKIITQEKGIT